MTNPTRTAARLEAAALSFRRVPTIRNHAPAGWAAYCGDNRLTAMVFLTRKEAAEWCLAMGYK